MTYKPDKTGYISTNKEVLELRQKQANRNALIAIVFTVVLVILSAWYSYYQYQLCYPEVSNSFWYCFQHAVGS